MKGLTDMALGTAAETVVRRLVGQRPSRFRALVVSAGAGTGTGTLTYKVLRADAEDDGSGSGGDED
jgi:hypothetical protein